MDRNSLWNSFVSQAQDSTHYFHCEYLNLVLAVLPLCCKSMGSSPSACPASLSPGICDIWVWLPSSEGLKQGSAGTASSELGGDAAFLSPMVPLWPGRQAGIHSHHLPKNNETFPEMAINIPCHDSTQQSLFDPGKCFKTQQSGIFYFF